MRQFVAAISTERSVAIPPEVVDAFGVSQLNTVIFVIHDDNSVSLQSGNFTLKSVAGSVPSLGRDIDVDELIREAKEEKAARDRARGLW